MVTTTSLACKVASGLALSHSALVNIRSYGTLVYESFIRVLQR